MLKLAVSCVIVLVVSTLIKLFTVVYLISEKFP
jgi:hypothetical protein